MADSKELQERLVVMLEWFHSFCEEHGLKYYILGGTMLGAIRHKGFIPWDDDVDVGMPVRDYLMLKRLLSYADGPYVLETPQSEAPDYCYPFCKLYDTATTFVEAARVDVVRGVYVDIFPLGGAGMSRRGSRLFYKRIDLLKRIRDLRIFDYRKDRSKWKTLVLTCIQSLPFRFIQEKRIAGKIESLSVSKDFDSCTYVGALGGAWGFKEVIPRSYFGVPTPCQFEGLMVYGVEDPDAYLTALYGDWRQLPPVEKQVSHHSIKLIDLNASYLDTRW